MSGLYFRAPQDESTYEKNAYEAQTDEARKEARNAIRERDEAKAEIVKKDNEICEMKDRADARERNLNRENSISVSMEPGFPMVQRPMATADTDGKARLRN